MEWLGRAERMRLCGERRDNTWKGSKDVSPCCRSGLSRRVSITFIGRLLLY